MSDDFGGSGMTAEEVVSWLNDNEMVRMQEERLSEGNRWMRPTLRLEGTFGYPFPPGSGTCCFTLL